MQLGLVASLSVLVCAFAIPLNEETQGLLQVQAPVLVSTDLSGVKLQAEVGDSQFFNVSAIKATQTVVVDASTYVRSCTSPEKTQYTVTPCTSTSDTVVALCTQVVPSGSFVSKACTKGDAKTAGADTVFTPCKTGSNGSFVSQNCSQGFYTKPGADSTLSACTTCSATQVVASPCTGSSNTVCADISNSNAICEGSKLDLSCDSGRVLKITSALYGRTEANICPGPNQQLTNCPNSGALAVVQGKCEGRASCSIDATNTVFGDPCGGTYKYLKVSSACVAASSEFTVTSGPVCEGSTLNIDCGSGKVIQINSANYGRTSTTVCPGQNQASTGCSSPLSLSNLQSACQGKQSCSFGANNGNFGDHCVGVYKYLDTSFTCKTGDVAAASGTQIICEGGTLNLDCGSKKIYISTANYGRTESTYCPGPNQATTNCKASTSLSVVKAQCDGKSTCSVAATNTVFNDPCGGVYKYLSVAYSCS